MDLEDSLSESGGDRRKEFLKDKKEKREEIRVSQEEEIVGGTNHCGEDALGAKAPREDRELFGPPTNSVSQGLAEGHRADPR